MEFRLNTTVGGTQSISALGTRSVAPLGTGFVAVHNDLNSASNQVRFQLFDSTGLRSSGERTLSNTAAVIDNAGNATVASSGTRFMIAWSVTSDASSDAGVRARIFDANGQPVSAVLEVPSTTVGGQGQPTVTSDGAGGFVVGFSGPDTPGVSTFLRRFDQNGNAIELYTGIGNNNQVNLRQNLATGGLDQTEIASTGTAIVAVIQQYPSSVDDRDVFIRVLPFAGTPTNEVLVNAGYSTGNQSQPSITTLTNGNTVIVWTSLAIDGNGFGVRLAVFNAAGALVAGEAGVNVNTTGDQWQTSVASLGTNYVVVWADLSVAGGGIRARLFDGATNAPIGGEITVESGTASARTSPDVIGLADGGFLVTWNQDGDVMARRFDGTGAAIVQPEMFLQASNQTIAGSANNDVIPILSGTISANDSITGAGGIDTFRLLDGGSFNLSSLALDGASTYRIDTTSYGVTGHTVTLPGAASTVYLGGAGRDSVTSVVGNHQVFLGGGILNSVVTVGTGTMTAIGEGGSTSFSFDAGGGALFGNGTTTVFGTGGTGAVTIVGSGDGSSFTASSVNDRLWIGGGTVVRAGDGDDLVVGSTGTQTVFGGIGADTIFAGPDGAVIDGGSGSDLVVGSGGNSRFVVGPGDTVWGGTGAEVFVPSGGAGTYVIANFDAAFDTLWLGDFNIASLGQLNAAAVGGGPVQASNGWTWTLTNPAVTLSVVSAQPLTTSNFAGGRIIIDGATASLLVGTQSADMITGDSGNDTLQGVGGNDTLIGGSGADSMSGGLGADRFVFRTSAESVISNTPDIITDYSTAGGDEILLSRWLFGAGNHFNANATVNLVLDSISTATTLEEVITQSSLTASTASTVEARLVVNTGSLGGTWLVVADFDGTTTTSHDLIVQLLGVGTAPTVILDPTL
ncbi:MAG: calcium-binding protein [Alphaproteobacteria bacterium]|nr:calcium-binding protein [Alphaproteobacteria bacterium]